MRFLEEGMKAYDDGMYNTAYSILKPLAEDGIADAQFQIGEMHIFGFSVKKDHSKSVEWFEKAADQGHVNAQYHLGCAYHRGHGVKQNNDEAKKWYKMAADQGHVEAKMILVVGSTTNTF